MYTLSGRYLKYLDCDARAGLQKREAINVKDVVSDLRELFEDYAAGFVNTTSELPGRRRSMAQY